MFRVVHNIERLFLGRKMSHENIIASLFLFHKFANHFLVFRIKIGQALTFFLYSFSMIACASSRVILGIAEISGMAAPEISKSLALFSFQAAGQIF